MVFYFVLFYVFTTLVVLESQKNYRDGEHMEIVMVSVCKCQL